MIMDDLTPEQITIIKAIRDQVVLGAWRQIHPSLIEEADQAELLLLEAGFMFGASSLLNLLHDMGALNLEALAPLEP